MGSSEAVSQGGAEAWASLHFGERRAEAGDADDRHRISVDARGVGLERCLMRNRC